MFKFIRRHKTRQYFEFVMDIIYNTASKYGLLITDLNPRNKYSAEMTICKPSDMRIGMILVVSIKDGTENVFLNSINTLKEIKFSGNP